MLVKNCYNCAFRAPETFEGVAQKSSRCTQMAFYRMGLMRVNDLEKEEVEFALSPLNTRPKQGLYNWLAQGYFIFSFVDFSAASVRTCKHHTSVMVKAQQTFEYYGDSVEDYPFTPKYLKDFLKSPVFESKHMDKLHPLCTMEWDYIDLVDQEILDQYKPCQSCEYYTQTTDDQGILNPYKGICTKSSGGIENNLFVALGGEGDRDTYSFLSCDSFKLAKIIAKTELTPITSRLYMVCDPNDPDISIEQYKKKLISPVIRFKSSVNLAHLRSLDLYEELKAKFKLTDRVSMEKDLGLDEQRKHFNQSVRQGNQHVQEDWVDRFKSYQEADKFFDGDPSITPYFEGYAKPDPK